jgi:hypothetical protein
VQCLFANKSKRKNGRSVCEAERDEQERRLDANADARPAAEAREGVGAMMSTLPNDETRTFTIEVSASIWRWLRALARENKVRAEDMLARAAWCMADAAGKNPTSPESDIGRRLLYSGGYNGDISPADSDRLRREDEAERLSQGAP